MSLKFYDTFSYCDILSEKPEIKIKGRSRFVNYFGIILGTICITLVTALSLIFITEVFSRTKFNLVYNLDNKMSPIIDIKNRQFALLLMDPLGNEFLDQTRLFSLSPKFIKIEITTKFQANYTSEYNAYAAKGSYIDIPLKSCSNLPITQFKEFYKTFSALYKTGICLDLSGFNETLYGKYGGLTGYSTLNIYINKCVNLTTINKTDCYPQDIIDKKLAQVFINLVSIENDVDANNYLYPFVPYIRNELLPISSTVFKNFYIDMNNVIFYTDNSFLFEGSDKTESSHTDRVMESVDLRGSNTLLPGTFAQITLRCSGKTEIFRRIYIKIPTTLSYIGGIMQATLFIGRILLYTFSKNNILNYLIINIFDLKEISNNISLQNYDINNKNSSFNNTSKNIFLSKTIKFERDKVREFSKADRSRKLRTTKVMQNIETHKSKADINANNLINHLNFKENQNNSDNLLKNQRLKKDAISDNNYSNKNIGISNQNFIELNNFPNLIQDSNLANMLSTNNLNDLNYQNRQNHFNMNKNTNINQKSQENYFNIINEKNSNNIFSNRKINIFETR